jgi:hypothetical protein
MTKHKSSDTEHSELQRAPCAITRALELCKVVVYSAAKEDGYGNWN